MRSVEEERAAFEVWFAEFHHYASEPVPFFFKRSESNHERYELFSVQDKWAGWAARAGIENEALG